jgi:hypothetical protein
MTTTTHTPGPWIAKRMLLAKSSKDRRSGFVVNGPDVTVGPDCDEPLQLPVRVCDLRVPAGMGGFAEGEANARLIAAAPELLDLLARALPFVEDAETDPAYKPGIVRKFAKEIRDAIESL